VTGAGRTVGALDIGSNTVRMLVARITESGLEIVLDRGAYASLGEGVDRTGMLREENQQHALDAIAAFVDEARLAGAEEIVAVATSAIRDAGNGTAFIERVQQATGVEAQIISGDREAELTALGATMGRDLDQVTVVVDLGGGSGEVIAMQGRTLQWETSLPIGSRRLTERFIQSDPPVVDQLESVSAHVRSLLRALPAASPRQGLFVGGTANTLPRVLGLSGPPTALARSDFDRILTIVQGLPADGLVQEFGVASERAEVLAAGAATLSEIARFYSLDAVVLPGTGIREGIIIEALQIQGR
jgi:exopolyphosphatase/guanosine-5'-triphosphate,3'-diphosphate pyrophosphatase